MKNSNSIFLEEMNDAIDKIGKNCNELKRYLNKFFESEDKKKFEEEYKNAIKNLYLSFDKDLKVKQKTLDDLKQKFKSFYENVLLVYENTFINNIKEYNKKLLNLIDDIIIEFEPPKENSFFSDKNIELSTSEKTNMLNNNYTYEQIGPNDLYENLQDCTLFNKNDNSKRENNIDNEQNKEICYFCTICSKKEAIYLCDDCNQLFCQDCFEFIKQNDNSNNKCQHNNKKKLSDIKGQNAKGIKLYINSLKHFFKSILIKSNYLLNNEIIKYKSMNDSQIDYIKKIYFKYPFIEKINDFNSEINFLKDINNILTNNYKIENLDSRSFSISNIDKKLVNLIESLFIDDPNNYKIIVENVKDINFEENEGDYKDEDYIIRKKRERKIVQYNLDNSLENKFFCFINLIPRERVSYNKKSLTSFLLNGIMKQFGIEKENIFLWFGEKKFVANYFIKTTYFSSMSLEEIKNKFQNEYEKIYEYKEIYENLVCLIDKEYLDCRGNTINPNSNINLFGERREYFPPPYGWVGIGLKVLDIYDENDWLEDISKWNQWCIAYQILSSNNTLTTLKNILTKNRLIEGNKKKNYKKNYGKSFGEDIYLTPYIDFAEKYTGILLLNKRRYKIVLMAKVLMKNLKGIKDKFWIYNQKNVRIYRILLKEIYYF